MHHEEIDGVEMTEHRTYSTLPPSEDPPDGVDEVEWLTATYRVENTHGQWEIDLSPHFDVYQLETGVIRSPDWWSITIDYPIGSEATLTYPTLTEAQDRLREFVQAIQDETFVETLRTLDQQNE